MTAIAIRPARPGDGPAIASAWLDAGRHYIDVDPERYQVPQEEGLAGWFEASLARLDDDRAVLVAEEAGVVLGFVAAHVERPHTEPWRQLQRAYGVTRVYVDALAVRSDRRRGGLGTRLMCAAEEWGAAQGARIVMVDSFVQGPSSTPFYEKRMGYRRRSIRFERSLRS